MAYNLPHRDCSGGASKGGAPAAAEYRGWIDQLIKGIGDQPALVILEPDALADLQCLDKDKRAERLGLINYAVLRVDVEPITRLGSRQHRQADKAGGKGGDL